MCYHCQIVSYKVLRALSKDTAYSKEIRRGLADSAQLSRLLRNVRKQALNLTAGSQSLSIAPTMLAAAPAVTVSDCKTTKVLPGTPIADPATSTDPTIVRALQTTQKVADFYRTAFGRNSIDDAGMTMASSVHYDLRYNNALWNGFQMIYGDGDGQIFLDFTLGNDVVAHELTHGVTQHSLQLVYADEAGGLNESISDVFGSMFRQWTANQTVKDADWRIGADIIGPQAKANGLTCLRDMSAPDAKHCLAPQIKAYKDYKPGMDPHFSSGVANLAFCSAAKAVGGKSWEKIGKVWYKAVTGFAPAPNLTMTDFATRTRQSATALFPADKVLAKAIGDGWKRVGL